MSSEKEILLNMNMVVSDFLLCLYKTQNNLIKIGDDINKLENTYFLENADLFIKLKEILDNKNTEDLLFRLNEFKSYIDFKIKNTCTQHNWIEDSIDITPDDSKTIIYCESCEIYHK